MNINPKSHEDETPQQEHEDFGEEYSPENQGSQEQKRYSIKIESNGFDPDGPNPEKQKQVIAEITKTKITKVMTIEKQKALML